MANLRVIAEIKPAGDFPVVDAPNVSVTGGKRLDVALSEAAAEVAKKANKSEVDTALASKANKSEVDAALAGKANKSEVDAAIENKADKSAFEAINASVSVNTSNIQELSTESTVLSARMDEFTKLKEGSTTGDAELADGRVGADGKTYDNIGGAIRGQVADLKSDLAKQSFAPNCPYIKEIYINSAGIAAGLAKVHLAFHATENSLRFSNSAGDRFVGKTTNITYPVYAIMPIYDYATSSVVYGYVIVDWNFLTEDYSPAATLNDKAFNIDYSPAIKEFLDYSLTQQNLTNLTNLTNLNNNNNTRTFNSELFGDKEYENVNTPVGAIEASNTDFIWFQYVDKKYGKINKIKYIAKTGTIYFYKVTYIDGDSTLTYSLITSVANASWENRSVKEISVNVTLGENDFIGVNGDFFFNSRITDEHYTRTYNISTQEIGKKTQQALYFTSLYETEIDKQISYTYKQAQQRNGEITLYNKSTTSENSDIVGTQNFDSFGLIVDDRLVINKYYSVCDRTVRYLCKFNANCVALFESVVERSGSYSSDTVLTIDVNNRTIKVGNLETVGCNIINATDTFMVSITKHYLDYTVNIYNMISGVSYETTYTNNGTGGAGEGAIGTSRNTGMQWDYYALNIQPNTATFSVAKIVVTCAKCDVLVYGDSITEPEAYYPKNVFDKSWTQLFRTYMKNRVLFSGRSGTSIDAIMRRIVNELPFIKPKYCMITIGTNGGVTVANLTALVEYIQSQNVIPILNHIPCYNNNGDTTGFITVNGYVDTVRANKSISGCDFDKATSTDGNGNTVDTTKMWYETYSDNSYYYHHPNVKGAACMFERMLIDIPEVFN